MARLKITKVKYSGKLYYFESPPLGDGVNLISGLNGSGKTTFCDFIYYGLGGVVSQFDPDGKERHKEIASDSDNFVELEVLLNNKEFKLKRFIGNNEIAIESKDNSIGIYPLYRQGLTKGNELFSDWFLDQLGFEIVTIYQGTISSKINITDLMRLIYHDQAPDPKKIYKDAVNSNYVSNSLEVRKAIFEILVGKLFQEYYTSYSNFRETEKLRDEQKYALKQFRNAVVKFKQYETESNLVFLTKELEEKRNQLKNLQQYRKSLRKRPLKKDASYREIEDLKVKNQEIILQLETYRKNKANFYYELSRLKNLQSETILEVIQITKIIQTHEKLKLFMPDTCPYCLNKVEREEGKCVCGNIVEESQYERFFYNEK
jgi:DNA repair exonuclease SbcCD ATPase subunit